jgi:hypothetical protein
VCTFHHIKLSGGQPVNTWDQADFDALVALYVAWWSNVKYWYPTGLVNTGIKFYRAGPAVVPPQPPVFESTQNVAGSAPSSSLPPQVALSVTERAGQKKNWGRFYLPAPASSSAGATIPISPSGRPSLEFMTDMANHADVLYEAALTANKPFVVYRKHLDAGREHEGDTDLAERPANAQTVDTLQVDDVFDVIRRRRWETVTLRLQRGIGAAQAEAKPAEETIDVPQQAEAAPADTGAASNEQRGEDLASSSSAGV